MNFTYKDYSNLIKLLKDHGYNICNFHNYTEYDKCAILRHDIDNSLEQAAKLSELERDLNVSSTYFVMLKSDFYNVYSKKSLDLIRRIINNGHNIGLHFDEEAYQNEEKDMIQDIQEEIRLLSLVVKHEISDVSMHRPSKNTLDRNLVIPGISFAYEKRFVEDFKYVSDSHRIWREPIEEIIKSGRYDKLQILTHAFWYHDDNQDTAFTIKQFIKSASYERYKQFSDNFTNLDSVLKEEEIV